MLRQDRQVFRPGRQGRLVVARKAETVSSVTVAGRISTAEVTLASCERTKEISYNRGKYNASTDPPSKKGPHAKKRSGPENAKFDKLLTHRKRDSEAIKSIPIITNLDQDLKKADGRIHKLRLDKLSKAVGVQSSNTNGKGSKPPSGMQSPSTTQKGASSAKRAATDEAYGGNSPVGYRPSKGDRVFSPLVHAGSINAARRRPRASVVS